MRILHPFQILLLPALSVRATEVTSAWNPIKRADNLALTGRVTSDDPGVTYDELEYRMFAEVADDLFAQPSVRVGSSIYGNNTTGDREDTIYRFGLSLGSY